MIQHTIIALALTTLVTLSAFAQESSTDNTNVIAIDIKSDGRGSTLEGTMTYSNEGPIGFRGIKETDDGSDNITVENLFGDDRHPAGRWVIAGREDRHVIAFNIRSNDNGRSLNGTITYAGEGEIRVRSKRGNGVVYDVNNQHDGDLFQDGAWVLGARSDKHQYVVAIDIASKDEGRTFGGTVTYVGEGPVRFRATQVVNNSYRAEVYFSDVWHSDGDWIIGGRKQRAVMVSAKSNDGGQTLSGSMAYRAEDSIGFAATISGGSAYTIENQGGDTNSAWNPGGVFVLGSRMRPDAASGHSAFPEGYFYLTTKFAENQDLVLESAPLTLREMGDSTGMLWKATSTKDGYFSLTSQFLEEDNHVLESSDGSGAAVMMPNNGVTGTQWKAVPAGDGYCHLTTRFTEDQGKVLSGNVGEARGAGAPFNGAPYMVEKTSAEPSTLWKFIPFVDHHYFHTEEKPHAAHWSYSGDTGPAHWGDLDASYRIAKTGKHQSPIDIRDALLATWPPLKFNYVPSRIQVINNGHTIEQTEDRGSFVIADEVQYELKQFHFHAPSEHTVNGKHYPMEMHLVHKSASETVAVVAVFIEEGESNGVFDWLLPAADQSPPDRKDQIDTETLMPAERQYFSYDGSFTTPPCTERVKWFVLKTPISLSKQQIDRFRKVIEGNNRPVQKLFGRPIHESM